MMKTMNIHERLTRFWFLLLLGAGGILGGYGVTAQAYPEPAGWYAGDMHVHRSCGGSPELLSSLFTKMSTNDLAVMSVLADMGNGEVQNPVTDLPLVNGQDASISTPDRIVHWDAEWHWDPTYDQYPHQVLGGHLPLLGLSEAHQIWEEYTFPILNWAHQQNGIGGFAHMQYLDAGLPQSLNCCKPIEYPVEVALGAADFISEDVIGDDVFVQAYYRLLNSGFRPGFAAGTDYPCGVSVIGSLLTYVQVPPPMQMTYGNWIEGIKQGRTVVSRNGHNEFLELSVNGTAGPGGEIKLPSSNDVQVTIDWTAQQNLTGTIELVQNGIVVASRQTSVAAGGSQNLTATVNFTKSGWLAARRMGGNGHVLHTGAVFVTVANQPVRVSAADAEFYVQWMDNLLEKTSPGGAWNLYFENDINRLAAQSRYQAAKEIYQQIASEAGASPSPLEISTTSLPDGYRGYAYSATLTASGGNTPYTWSIASGLPPGLTQSNGTIAGTPTTAGTYSFSVQLSDSGNPVQTAAMPLTLTIADTPPPATTIWSVSATPAMVSDPDTAEVELGVKFRSSVNGFITGIRFYKGSANTGTHMGSLWDVNGNLLAQAAFGNETAPGWQQVNFASPVAISANTVYVASYHAPNGRYSVDQGYFTAAGISNAHLYALRDGESGGNGVYRYGAVGFPSSTYQSSNYWVDVVFQPATSALLTAITLSPANPSISVGATQQFTATGLYSDGRTQDVTSQAVWASSNTAAATVNSSGLVTAIAPGTATISATLSGMSQSTTLTVQSSPLAITTASLPNGVLNTAYSAILAASGGTLPHTWSITSGSLPPGLTLDNETIAGTPTTAGSYSLIIQVSDSGNPMQTAAMPLSITIADTPPLEATIWPSTAVPAVDSDSDNAAVELGVKFKADINGQITGIRFYKGAANTGTHVGTLWDSNGNLLAQAIFDNETASGWQQVNLASPVSITADTIYVASYHTNTGHYAVDADYFATSGVDNPPLHALSSASSGGNGIYIYSANPAFPVSTYLASNYWVDVVFTTGMAADNISPTAPGNLAATATSATQINLNWSPATDNIGVTGYQVERCQGAGCSNFVQIATPTTTTLSDSGLIAGTTYQYRVRANDAAGNNSDYSNVASATTLAASDTQPPTVSVTAPANGSTVSGTGVAVSATASDNMGVVSVQFLLDGAPLGAPDTVEPYSIAWDSTTVPNGSHTLSALARDAANNSATAANVLVTVSNTATSAPSALKALAVSTTQINLSWTDNATNEIGFKIERCQGSGCTNFAVIATLGSNVTTYANTGLLPNTSYSYRMVAYNGIGDSAYSNTATAATPRGVTTFLSPTANAPVTLNAGDQNGFQTAPANAYANDGLFAVDTNSGTGTGTACTNTGKDRHVYYNYGFSLPSGATIRGIEVRLDAKVDSALNLPKMCVQLSWNGGATWTVAKSTATLTTAEATYILGGAADAWGRTWTAADFSNANFRLRITNVATSTARDFSLDWAAVRVTYR